MKDWIQISLNPKDGIRCVWVVKDEIDVLGVFSTKEAAEAAFDPKAFYIHPHAVRLA